MTFRSFEIFTRWWNWRKDVIYQISYNTQIALVMYRIGWRPGGWLRAWSSWPWARQPPACSGASWAESGNHWHPKKEIIIIIIIDIIKLEILLFSSFLSLYFTSGYWILLDFVMCAWRSAILMFYCFGLAISRFCSLHSDIHRSAGGDNLRAISLGSNSTQSEWMRQQASRNAGCSYREGNAHNARNERKWSVTFLHFHERIMKA